MKLRKILIVMAFPTLLNFIAGCCDCLETKFFDYTNCSVSIESLDNAGQAPVVSSSDTILKAAFGMRIHVERKQDICDNYFQPIFISSAFATTPCECPPEEIYLLLDSIVSINVITLNDFDSIHLADNFITDYFSILRSRSAEFVSIDEFLNRQFYEFYDIADSTLTFDLMLMRPPKTTSSHRFEVRIVLSDGRVLSTTSNLIQLI
jgi:Domain of unknown function (DUF5034)